jgi:hypothetical protein
VKTARKPPTIKYLFRWIVLAAVFVALHLIPATAEILFPVEKIAGLALLICIPLDLFVVDRALTRIALPRARNAVLKLGLWEHQFRQDFLIGHLAPGKTTEDLVQKLLSLGFEHNVLAWVDPDEVLNQRKLLPDGKYQYHVRLHSDGEVRAHKEIAPEHSAIKHVFEHDFTPSREYFHESLGELLVPVKAA